MTEPTQAHVQPSRPTDPDLSNILNRIARKADVIRLDAKSRGNHTLASDATEIMGLADFASRQVRQ